jgi:hypothetical protein
MLGGSLTTSRAKNTPSAIAFRILNFASASVLAGLAIATFLNTGFLSSSCFVKYLSKR